MHKHSTFITLTYNMLCYGGLDESSATLWPKHLSDWLKRLRRKTSGGLRYFACGEYGELTERPHFHVALFGYPNCIYSRSQYSSARRSCCPACDLIRETWGKGHVYLGTLTPDSSSYIAGYVTKKMTKADDARLRGRYPEKAWMSRKPGIGAPSVPVIVDALTKDEGSIFLVENMDVPDKLQMAGKQYPLGRYLKGLVREAYGFGSRKPTEEYKEKIGLQMSELQEVELQAAFDKKKNWSAAHKMLIDERQQKILNIETKQNIYKKKGSL